MKIVRVSADPIDPLAELACLGELGGGAVASFTGIARKDRDVVGIELEHYAGMTEACLHGIIGKAGARWPLLGAVIVHRVGYVAVGEPVVVTGAASLHRAAALEATAYLIDCLKTDAPFWKKEHYSDGRANWVVAKASDDARAAHWKSE